MNKQTLIQIISEFFQDALKAQGKDWDSARVMVSYFAKAGDEGTLTCLYRTEDQLGGILLDPGIWKELNALRAILAQESGMAVMRLRVAHDDPLSSPVLDHFSDSVEGSVDWVWPDEQNYAGRRYEAPSINRIASHDPVDLTDTPPVVRSLERIVGWLNANAPEVAARVNPSASIGQIEATEERMGVRFPPSLREAYLLHNGQSDSRSLSVVLHPYGWHSLDAVEDFWSSLNSAPGPRDDVSLIPVMDYGPGIPVYVESADSADVETPVVEWRVREDVEYVRADSFGAFLEEFAEALEAGRFAYRDEQLYPVEDLGEIFGDA